MEPKTKQQKRVVELSKKLPPITEAQKAWARENVYKPAGYLRTKTIWCLECGQNFETSHELGAQLLGEECPHCRKELKVTRSNKRKFDDNWYYTIFDRKQEFQVLRHFIVNKVCKPGYPAEIYIHEVVQNWISPKGVIHNIARNTAPFTMCYDKWQYSSQMELRGAPRVYAKYGIHAEYIYPRKKIIPELRRNGFRGGLHDMTPCGFMSDLLKKPEIETLLKAKQFSLLKYFSSGYSYSKISEYWPYVKICIRNNYIVKNASTWCDYIEMLKQFHEDIRSAHFVCPKNLKLAHDRYVEKSRRRRKKEKIEEMKKKLVKQEPIYKQFIERFLDLSISDGNLVIEPLKSVHEFFEEGDELHHCVYSSNYWKDKNALILSAKINGRRVETVQFNLKLAKVVQSRGLQNKNTKHHDRIVELVNSNSNMIVNRDRENKKMNTEHLVGEAV